MAEAVCDAGPLIHLAEIGRENLLGQFTRLFIPERVLQEALSFKPPLGLSFERVEISDEELRTARKLFTSTLDAGEADALTFCFRRPSTVFLTDDRKARKEAEQHSIQVHGSAGIIVRACRTGLIRAAESEKALRDLACCRSLFISKAIVEFAIQQLRELQE